MIYSLFILGKAMIGTRPCNEPVKQKLLQTMENRISIVQSKSVPDNDSGVAEKKTKCISYRLDRLIAFSGGDSESFKQVMNSLIRSCKQNVRLFAECLHEKDDEAISDLSHKMLTLFRYLEASEIVKHLVILAQRKSDFAGSAYYYALGNSVLEMIESLIQTIQKNEPRIDYSAEIR